MGKNSWSCFDCPYRKSHPLAREAESGDVPQEISPLAMSLPGTTRHRCTTMAAIRVDRTYRR